MNQDTTVWQSIYWECKWGMLVVRHGWRQDWALFWIPTTGN